MSREPTFQCECGVTCEQSKRGIPRTRCKDCDRKHKNEWMKNYQQRKKAAAVRLDQLAAE